MEKAKFECKRCGHCCKSMRGNMMGQLHGLMILPFERYLFPEETIKPMFRFYPVYGSSRSNVWMYQVDADGCPHYDDELECTIYKDRPLICRAYPFEAQGEKMVVHGNCPEISRLKEERMELIIPKHYVEAARFIQQTQFQKIRDHQISELVPRGVQLQRFDLETQKWRGMMEGMNEEAYNWLKGSK